VAYHKVDASGGIATDSDVATELAKASNAYSWIPNIAGTEIIINCKVASDMCTAVNADPSKVTYDTAADWLSARTITEWHDTSDEDSV